MANSNRGHHHHHHVRARPKRGWGILDRWDAPFTPNGAGIAYGSSGTGESYWTSDQRTTLMNPDTNGYVVVSKQGGYNYSPALDLYFAWLPDESAIYGPGTFTLSVTARAPATTPTYRLTIGSDYYAPLAYVDGTFSTDWSTLTTSYTWTSSATAVQIGFLRSTDTTPANNPETLDVAWIGTEMRITK